MKKTLLTLAIFFSIAGFAKAANIVEDWTTASTWAITDWTDTDGITPKKATSTATNIEYEFLCTNVNTKYEPNYLFLRGTNFKTLLNDNNKKASVSFALPIKCSEIIVSTSGFNSTNASNKINVFVGETAIASQVAVNAHNEDFKIAIPEEYRAAGTVYRIESNTNSYNQQFLKFTYVEATTAPKLSASTDELSFATPLNGTQEQTVKISAENITDNLTVAVDNDAFTLASSTVSVEDAANGIVVTYTGATAGNVTAKLTVSAANVTAEVALSALTVAHAGTETDPLTVADVIAMNSLNKTTVYVQGIINDKTAKNAVDGKIQENATAVNSNILLKDADGNMIPVAITGEARTTLNIVDNPDNAGQTVIVKGSLENYFGAPGVKNTEYVSGLSSTTAIDEIGVDATEAPVEYFNLQGQRVNNPENGLFIRRQGDKVTKVIIR